MAKKKTRKKVKKTRKKREKESELPQLRKAARWKRSRNAASTVMLTYGNGGWNKVGGTVGASPLVANRTMNE